ncbi:enoyl-CoA hydratase/isomerase [Colletotrichum scovillei]|uniref:Enoyl-CoA hydratase/isomerase n=1 Tax=Colletotrichum scovillei TaxID=1209932 RepID=A0A9P7UHC6_9PEZI|nr:enoyl-CoA hydratase/isomerase [Colletotrichum scovillei]KAG7071641.1 enoyl-CoA hydratase/isomerase [Colletotrichum scovillei]KAG7079892.1 enoyl-CoA hydratase/isomerase [Colletotrichum scovillei]
MASQTPLFTIPIPELDSHEGGTIVCTTSAPQVYLLTWSSPPDNRLTTPFCKALLAALDIIEFAHPPGVLVTTSAITKFYSNGLDLEHAFATPRFFPDTLYALFKRLLTYPMPTVALIPGHAFAGGFMTAMHHDYRVMNPQKGFLCMNELEFGAPLKPPMSAIFRIKCASPKIYQDIVLEAKRFPGPAALEAGLVDALGGLDEALKLIAERKLTERGKSGVYAVLKMEMWKESAYVLSKENYESEEKVWDQREELEKVRVAAGKRFVQEWKAGKAKL